jgi:hypothetical protein
VFSFERNLYFKEICKHLESQSGQKESVRVPRTRGYKRHEGPEDYEEARNQET